MTHKESYNICEISDREVWDTFVTSQKEHTFLHSWAWGEFNAAMGDTVWRLGILKKCHKSDDRPSCVNLIGVVLLIKVHARRGNFLFIPHGPILKSDLVDPEGEMRQILEVITEQFKQIARQEKVGFIRVSPLLNDTKKSEILFRELGFRDAPIHMHAETTWTLDVNPTEDELLMNMRKTTRNLIRRATKEGVKITTGDSERDVEIFNTLYQETVSKHNFTPFNLTYLKKQVRIFKTSDEIKIFTALYRNEPIASAIIVFYGNSAFYHHGASSQKYPKIPAAYLVQWEAIKEAKRRGHRLYNFWGIVKEETPRPSSTNTTARRHPWAGITLFKKGFGGFQSDYLHARDLPISWRYWPSYLLETTRRMRRGL